MTRVPLWSALSTFQNKSHKKKTAPRALVQGLRGRQELVMLDGPAVIRRAAVAAATSASALADEIHRASTTDGYVPDFEALLGLVPALTPAQWEQLLMCPTTVPHLLTVVTALKRASGALDRLAGPDGLFRIFLAAVKAADTRHSARLLTSLVAVLGDGRIPVTLMSQLGTVAAVTVAKKPTTVAFEWFLAQAEVKDNLVRLLPAMARAVVSRDGTSWLLCLWGAAVAARVLPLLGRALGQAQRERCVSADLQTVVNQLLRRLVPDYGCCGLDAASVGAGAGGRYSTTMWLHAPFVFHDATVGVLPFGHAPPAGTFDAVEDEEYYASFGARAFVPSGGARCWDEDL